MQNGYESIAYTKDFLQGSCKTEIKHKENRGIKGKATLSLYEKGEKVKEAYTENLIPDNYFKDLFMKRFIGDIMGVGSRGSDNYDWFNYLYLTDSDKPELPTDSKVEGNVIGYAHRNDSYAGSDDKRGTINFVENRFEIINNKVRVNLVFDFPTHAANGTIESLYFAQADPEHKDYFYVGPTIWGRDKSDGDYTYYGSSQPKKYFGLYYGLGYALNYEYVSIAKGFAIIDFKSTTFTQSTYITCPERLKGHMVYMPFDLGTEDVLQWEQAVTLLDQDGNALVADDEDEIKEYNRLTYAAPYQEGEETYILGYYTYNKSNDEYMRIYTWSKVGILLNYVDINVSELLKNIDYDTQFVLESRLGRTLATDGCIEVVGYTRRFDDMSNEYVYENIWAKIDRHGAVIQRMDITPKFGNSTWFTEKGLDGSNISRRAYISTFNVSKNVRYFHYYGTQGGSSFWQSIDLLGNIKEPYRRTVSIDPDRDNYQTYKNIVGTDEWLVQYRYTDNGYINFRLDRALISRPIGTHTRLAESIEKTEANTMKVQYMFEVDLVSY